MSLDFSWLQQFLKFSLFFFLILVKYFCKLFLNWDLSDVFFKSRLGPWVLGTETTEAKCPAHHITLLGYIISMIHHCHCWPWSPDWRGAVSFLHCKITAHLCLHTILLEGWLAAQSTWEKLCSTFLKGNIYIDYLQFGWEVCPFSAVYLFIQLFVYSSIYS